MVDPIDDIAKQARQGSVSAIIQVLNDKLADSGVRTRAIFADGVLQLLCEAATPEQLEQSTLVERVRQILESIQPRNIRRININSRIVKEQQLLWLEEINRNPENELLWVEEIKLARPNPFKRFLDDLSRRDRPEPNKNLPTPSRNQREKRQFWRGITGGISLSLLLLLVGWVASDWFQLKFGTQSQAETPEPEISPSPSPTATAPPVQDPFVQAVRIAEQASIDGQSAQSLSEWLDLATRWQRASELMAKVPAGDSRYPTAQDRAQRYQQNSKSALAQAQLRQTSPPTQSPAQRATQSPAQRRATPSPAQRDRRPSPRP